MVDPNPGAPVTQQTYVYVCYDDERIYFGIYMIEDELESIQATVNERDGDVWMDDALELIIDTYCDRRNAYFFASNLLGAKLDGRIIDDGRNVDKTWDGHWKTKSHLTSPSPGVLIFGVLNAHTGKTQAGLKCHFGVRFQNMEP